MAEENKFRIHSKSVMLTYARCYLDKEDVKMAVDEILKANGWFLTKWCICNEIHADGAPHVHYLIKLNTKMQIKNCRFFDIKWEQDDGTYLIEHPNIVKVGKEKNYQKKLWYVQKGGDWTSGNTLPNQPMNYVKNKKDWTSWQRDVEIEHIKDQEEIELPGGMKVATPTTYNRQYIIWIRTKPDWGKSSWRKTALKKYYLVDSMDNYPMEDYAGQQYIVFDDWEGKFTPEFLVRLGEFDHVKRSVGRTRYEKVYFRPNVQRYVIILCNWDVDMSVMQNEKIVSRILVNIQID